MDQVANPKEIVLFHRRRQHIGVGGDQVKADLGKLEYNDVDIYLYILIIDRYMYMYKHLYFG